MTVDGRSESSKQTCDTSSRRSGITIKSHETKMMKTVTDTKRRLCEQCYEATDHVISAYPILAQEQYNSDMCSTTP
jgi:hypothetical protein